MSKEILVCNSGSSSLKLDVFQSGEYLSYLASASVDRIGQMQGAESELEVKIKDRETHTERSRFEDHRSALLRISELLEKEIILLPTDHAETAQLSVVVFTR